MQRGYCFDNMGFISPCALTQPHIGPPALLPWWPYHIIGNPLNRRPYWPIDWKMYNGTWPCIIKTTKFSLIICAMVHTFSTIYSCTTSFWGTTFTIKFELSGLFITYFSLQSSRSCEMSRTHTQTIKKHLLKPYLVYVHHDFFAHFRVSKELCITHAHTPTQASMCMRASSSQLLRQCHYHPQFLSFIRVYKCTKP
jgi:hypothetical protein